MILENKLFRLFLEREKYNYPVIQNMRSITFKIAVAILAFVIGVTAVALWFIYPASLNQFLQVPSDSVVLEEVEEYAVYSAAINHLLVKDRDSVRLFAIENQTSFYSDNFHKAIYGEDYVKNTTSEQRVKQMNEWYPSISDETLFDYDAKKMQSHKLHRNFNLSVGYILINEANYKKYNDYWMIRLSRVGLNKERNQAFVFVQYCCGMGGYSDYLLLEKIDGNWKIKEVFMGLRS